MWIAQCLEHDIAAQGATFAGAKDAFARAVAAQIAVAVHHGEEPLATFEPAPQQYWELFAAAERLTEPIRVPELIEIPPAFMINAAQKTLADSWIAV